MLVDRWGTTLWVEHTSSEGEQEAKSPLDVQGYPTRCFANVFRYFFGSEDYDGRMPRAAVVTMNRFRTYVHADQPMLTLEMIRCTSQILGNIQAWLLLAERTNSGAITRKRDRNLHPSRGSPASQREPTSRFKMIVLLASPTGFEPVLPP